MYLVCIGLVFANIRELQSSANPIASATGARCTPLWFS
jgi:hypothetical protein